jgi:hypothetical protein
LAWGNLTHIDLGFVTISVFDVAFLLRWFARAEHLFATDVSTGLSMPDISRVRLSYLTPLNFHGFGVNDVSIFDTLVLPRLTLLELRDVCGESLLCLHAHAPFALHDLTLVFVHITSRAYLCSSARCHP